MAGDKKGNGKGGNGNGNGDEGGEQQWWPGQQGNGNGDKGGRQAVATATTWVMPTATRVMGPIIVIGIGDHLGKNKLVLQ